MKLGTIYKRTKGGKIQEWTIEVQGNKYRTISGQTDGKKVISKWTIAKPKNEGKSNETTAEEQAIKEAQARRERRLEQKYFENIDDIDSGSLFESMLAGKYKKWQNKPVYSQPKLDGVRCHVDSKRMFSRSGKDYVSCPHILKELSYFAKKHGVIFDGELYSHKYKHDFNKIISLVRKTKPTEKDIEESSDKVEYHIYDVYIPGLTFSERWEWLEKNLFSKLSSDTKIKKVETNYVESEEELDKLYSFYMEDGYEGQMVRHGDSEYETKRSKHLLKRKEFEDEEFEIIEVIEGAGNRSGMAGRVLVQKEDGTRFRAGIKGGEEYYKKLFIKKDSVIGEKATIRFQGLTPDGIPRFPVMHSIRNYE